MRWILKYTTTEEEAQAMKAHSKGCTSCGIQMKRSERSKSAKGQKLCCLMENQPDPIYGDLNKKSVIFLFFISPVTGIFLTYFFIR